MSQVKICRCWAMQLLIVAGVLIYLERPCTNVIYREQDPSDQRLSKLFPRGSMLGPCLVGFGFKNNFGLSGLNARYNLLILKFKVIWQQRTSGFHIAPKGSCYSTLKNCDEPFLLSKNLWVSYWTYKNLQAPLSLHGAFQFCLEPKGSIKTPLRTIFSKSVIDMLWIAVEDCCNICHDIL